MAEDFDTRLVESAKARKHRLDDALLFGSNPQERRYSSTGTALMYSLLVAALVAAICVGFSFVQQVLAEQNNAPARAIHLPWTDSPA